jgi:protein gp37
MAQTSIEWTDFSINPIRARYHDTGAVGHHCIKIAPECANCYASRLQPRFGMPQFQHQVRLRKEGEIDIFLDMAKLQEVFRRRKPTKWFWCDMTDMFGEWVNGTQLDACFATMAVTPQHTHQILTKRPEQMQHYIRQLMAGERLVCERARWQFDNTQREDLVAQCMHAFGSTEEDLPTQPLRNVWLGVSAGTQETADKYIPTLLNTPAAVRWVSAEPLLEPVDLSKYLQCQHGCKPGANTEDGVIYYCGTPTIDWGVVSGESGPGARPFVLGHGKEIVRQFKAAGKPVFVKQAGSYPTNREGIRCPYIKHPKGGNMNEWPEELRIREFPA